MNCKLRKMEKQHNQTTQPNNAQPNNIEETLKQEQKVNLENLKIIMNGAKTTLPSLWILERRTSNTEKEKNKSSTNLYINE